MSVNKKETKTSKRSAARMADHYVNNRDFTAAVSDWVRARKQAQAEGKDELPPVPDYVGDCFSKIAHRYALKPRWSSCSSYLDDMISEAILTCLKYAHNFNPDKSQNAFAYFTQCCHLSFFQFINKEKKIAKFKFEMVKEANPDIAKMDYNNINLWNEEHDIDNPDLVEKTESEVAIAAENAEIAQTDHAEPESDEE